MVRSPDRPAQLRPRAAPRRGHDTIGSTAHARCRACQNAAFIVCGVTTFEVDEPCFESGGRRRRPLELTTDRRRRRMPARQMACTMEFPPTIHGVAAQRNRISASELVERCLERIARFEPQVRAWVMVDIEAARASAQRLDQEQKQGRCRGPLHGIPIGIKDIIDVAGWPTKAGSPLRENHRAEQDAPIVSRLRNAGAIILGKTVTTQFASFDPPPTRNPWNLRSERSGFAERPHRRRVFRAVRSTSEDWRA
jgi:hypothetical protein